MTTRLSFADLPLPGYRHDGGVAPRLLAAAVQELGGPTMGTRWSVKYWHAPATPGPARREVREAIEIALDLVVRQMSTWEDDSDLSRYNRAAPGRWQKLPEPLFSVLQHALELARATGGAYDPTVGPAVNLWGFGPDPARRDAPTEGDLEMARRRIGWQRVQLDVEQRRARQDGGTYVDLSSIAKGYAVDAVARALQRLGCGNALVEVGGELLGMGRRPDGQPWRVAVRLPGLEQGDAGPVLALKGLAVATSGDDFRCFETDDGERHSHTIDPRTGRPVRHALASVTVVHAQCMQADALATALTVLGPDEGWTYAERERLAVLFIRRAADGGHEARPTAGFEALLA
ncbi:MAG: FAD:protein FMN transferase [Methylibium sp.]|uniref:FAD:protein FMN transferase n=1 Tax=Methylibium petroleiphilum (strain ATCC BAA-1232 / LMG 22953 / PM1) TaxID=420662 RepID=A2SM91_METPP|nr:MULTISPECIES: FAD:protein FMN transferase [Methylibium]ABM96680.1 thiamine biosynthesis protein [Methylibium petroleiphilum PM1]EWS58732.1 Thiamine biosynthesis lipoprotein ApbE precursor [Methylibium sp. T29-B]